MDSHDTIVYGERLDDLWPALSTLRDSMRRRADGSYRFNFALDLEIAAPFRRALMRAEAELMLEDADRIGSASENERSYEERAGDALIRLAQALPNGRVTRAS